MAATQQTFQAQASGSLLGQVACPDNVRAVPSECLPQLAEDGERP
jgi:hypothetical protein